MIIRVSGLVMVKTNEANYRGAAEAEGKTRDSRSNAKRKPKRSERVRGSFAPHISVQTTYTRM